MSPSATGANPDRINRSPKLVGRLGRGSEQ